MNMPADSASQVVIVGGGPVGLGLAIDLGQSGFGDAKIIGKILYYKITIDSVGVLLSFRRARAPSR